MFDVRIFQNYVRNGTVNRENLPLPVSGVVKFVMNEETIPMLLEMPFSTYTTNTRQ